jgi:L-arabinose isomerase
MKNKIEKQNLNIAFNEKGDPIALLFRTKEGKWVWMAIVELDEEGQIELLEQLQNKNNE